MPNSCRLLSSEKFRLALITVAKIFVRGCAKSTNGGAADSIRAINDSLVTDNS